SSAALEALDAIGVGTAEATSHAQGIAAAAGDQDKAFGKLRQRIHAVAEIAGKKRAEADDVATRADEAARGLTDLERATRELEEVAAMLRELTRGFAASRRALTIPALPRGRRRACTLPWARTSGIAPRIS